MDLCDPAVRLPDEWPTEAALGRAFRAYAAAMEDFRLPAAFGLSRADGDCVTLAEVNGIGRVRPLPAAVLAYVAGWDGQAATIRLTRAQVAEALERLDPSDAAGLRLPDLCSWQALLDGGRAGSRFAAHFLARAEDVLDDPAGAAFVQAATAHTAAAGA